MSEFLEELKLSYKGTQPSAEKALDWVKSMLKIFVESGAKEFSWDGTCQHEGKFCTLSTSNREYVLKSLRDMGFCVEGSPYPGLIPSNFVTISGWA